LALPPAPDTVGLHARPSRWGRETVAVPVLPPVDRLGRADVSRLSPGLAGPHGRSSPRLRDTV